LSAGGGLIEDLIDNPIVSFLNNFAMIFIFLTGIVIEGARDLIIIIVKGLW
jgi:hypothetical protein